MPVGTYAVASGSHSLSVAAGARGLHELLPGSGVRGAIRPDSTALVRADGAQHLVRSSPPPAGSLPGHETAALGFDPTSPTRAADFAKLVAQGRQLFLNETFNGNGRTCGTCHVESNNFTIDPEFISTLPASDPLFVAETNPALATLENPDLLRRLGLILVNADGFDPSRGLVLRATQNVQALGNSTMPQDPSFFIDFSTNGRNPNPPERLGWGNDGAPLRDFALVAIVQHAPKSLTRMVGVDFRVPTDEELDALVAYQLPLGRQEDFDLPLLELKSTLASSRQDAVPGQRKPSRTRPQELQRLSLQRWGHGRNVVQLADAGIPAYRRQSTRFQHRCCDERE